MGLVDAAVIEGVLGNVIAKSDYSTKRVLPFMVSGERNWVLPHIGKELYDKLVVSAGNSFTDTPAGDWKVLRDLVCELIVWAGYYEYLPFSLGADSGNGMTEMKSDTVAPVRMGVVNMRLMQAKVTIGKCLDAVMDLLFEKRAIYTEWATSVVGEAALKLLVRSGKELREVFPPGSGYWLWRVMKEYFRLDGRRYLEPVLGSDLCDVIFDGLADGTLSGRYENVRLLGAGFVCWKVYEVVLPTMVVVQAEDGGLRVLSEFDGINNRKTATEAQLKVLYDSVVRGQADALDRLKDYLVKYASEIGEYVVPEVSSGDLPRFMRNEGKERIFGL